MTRGAKVREPNTGEARYSSLSTGMWDVNFEGGWFVGVGSGITLE